MRPWRGDSNRISVVPVQRRQGVENAGALRRVQRGARLHIEVEVAVFTITNANANLAATFPVTLFDPSLNGSDEPFDFLLRAPLRVRDAHRAAPSFLRRQPAGLKSSRRAGLRGTARHLLAWLAGAWRLERRLRVAVGNRGERSATYHQEPQGTQVEPCPHGCILGSPWFGASGIDRLSQSRPFARSGACFSDGGPLFKIKDFGIDVSSEARWPVQASSRNTSPKVVFVEPGSVYRSSATATT